MRSGVAVGVPVRWGALVGAIGLLVAMAGCQSYRERFTYHDPKSGATNHVVDVSFRSFLVWGKAAKLRTETQTMEFIRSVNAEGLESRPDADAIRAVAEGVASAALKSVAP